MSTIDLTDDSEVPGAAARQASTVFFDPIVERYAALIRQKAKLNNKAETESERLLKRIERKCEWENVYCISKMPKLTPANAEKQALHFTVAYTGFTEQAINRMEEQTIKCETIEDTIRYQSLLRASINAIYTNKSFPTTPALMKFLGDQVPPYWCTATFKKHLKEIGYVNKRIMGTKWRYLVERPQVTFERFRYLKKIIECREDGRPVFFIEENFYDANGNYMKLSELEAYESIYKGRKPPAKWFIIYAISEEGIRISKIYDIFQEFDFTEWVLEELLPLLPEASVIVYLDGNRKLESKTRITMYSTKTDVMAYLDSHGVPYSEDMCKAELLELVDKVQDTSKASKLEETIKSEGFEVLRLPRSLRSLTPGSL